MRRPVANFRPWRSPRCRNTLQKRKPTVCRRTTCSWCMRRRVAVRRVAGRNSMTRSHTTALCSPRRGDATLTTQLLSRKPRRTMLMCCVRIRCAIVKARRRRPTASRPTRCRRRRRLPLCVIIDLVDIVIIIIIIIIINHHNRRRRISRIRLRILRQCCNGVPTTSTR